MSKERLPKVLLCTLFDSNFLLQGLTMIESINIHTDLRIDWVVLALDDYAFSALTKLKIPNLRIEKMGDFPDTDLNDLIGKRNWRELCWTSASCLLNFTINLGSRHEYVGYVDADCFFVNDILIMLKEIPMNKKIAIHEHNFSIDRINSLETSGRFNVGVVLGRPTEDFIQCVKKWRIQVLNSCVIDPANGQCGDQTYLNEWPENFKSLHIFKGKGIGLAPWNLNNYVISKKDFEIQADDDPVVFYHFHGLTFKYFKIFGFCYVPAAGYLLNYIPIDEIYNPYFRLMQITSSKYRIPINIRKIQMKFIWMVRQLCNTKWCRTRNY